MRPIILAIMDGTGLRDETYGNAFKQASKPALDYLMNEYPFSKLEASGEAVGLPRGQMGNSEVGHENMGAGRLVLQSLLKINKSIEDKTFFKKEVLLNAIDYCKKENVNMHICGILSDGAIHGHINHLFAILDLCKEQQFNNIYIHLFLDGRDTPPLVAPKYVEALQVKLNDLGFGKIATIQGRYYGMNRDRNWELTELGYKAIVNGEGVNYANNTKEAFDLEYKEDLTDEFMKPTVLLEDNKPVATIKENDAILMYNYREDRMVQLLHAFNDKDFNDFKRDYIKTKYITMTSYEEKNNYDNVDIIFKHEEDSKNNLGEVIDYSGLSQLRITEFEKSKHVTFFFDGCRDKHYPKEDIIIFDRPDVFTYDLMPEMRSEDITNKIVESVKEHKYDLIVVNFPNGDAVGHSGILEAAIKAVEAVDRSIKKIYDAIQDTDYTLIITADHGNCEHMIDENGGPDKMHTTNPVPFIICDKEYKPKDGKLSDIAPTILTIMGIPVPEEMTGNILI